MIGTENRKETKKKVEEREIVDTTRTGSRAAEPKPGPEVKLLRSAIEKGCFIPDPFVNSFKDEFELVIGSALIEK